MVRSMTGFGRGEILENNKKFTVEIKAVNHRYFDVNIRLPKELSCFDAQVRSTLRNYIERGKVDVNISWEDYSENNVSIKYNEAVAAQYVEYYRQIAEKFGLKNDIGAAAIGRSPEVFSLVEQMENDDEVWLTLEKALTQAYSQLRQTRTQEGDNLRRDLLEKLDHMDSNVYKIEKRYPDIVTEYTQRLKNKVSELLGDAQVDEDTLAAQIVMYSDKIATDEETVRLHSHISSMKDALQNGAESVGRKLDFIAQEMNREANTILSKANDLETSNIAIDLKTEIEKVREQIQNIE